MSTQAVHPVIVATTGPPGLDVRPGHVPSAEAFVVLINDGCSCEVAKRCVEKTELPKTSRFSPSHMGHQCYAQSGRRWQRAKGFRLNSSRFSVLPLRLRFLGLIGLLTRCLESINRGVWCAAGRGSRRGRAGSRYDKSTSRSRLACHSTRCGPSQEYKLQPPVLSNAFYADAIADCLEFIKRTSVTMGDTSPTER